MRRKVLTAGDGDAYVIGEPIQHGPYSSVYKCFSAKATYLQFVAKIYNRSNMERFRDALQVLTNEVNALYAIQSPYICNKVDIFDSDRNIYIIEEFAEGGNLLREIKKNRGGMNSAGNDKKNRKWLRQLLWGLSDIHKAGFIHADIKVENICLNAYGDIKICDFGFATPYEAGVKLSRDQGTPMFACPQILASQPYDGPRADVWSAGVTLFVMLTGCVPFSGRSNEELYTKIMRRQIPEHPNISPGARHFLQCCLQVEEEKRWSVEQLLHHPYCRGLDVMSRMVGSSGNYSGSGSPLDFHHHHQLATPLSSTATAAASGGGSAGSDSHNRSLSSGTPSSSKSPPSCATSATGPGGSSVGVLGGGLFPSSVPFPSSSTTTAAASANNNNSGSALESAFTGIVAAGSTESQPIIHLHQRLNNSFGGIGNNYGSGTNLLEANVSSGGGGSGGAADGNSFNVVEPTPLYHADALFSNASHSFTSIREAGGRELNEQQLNYWKEFAAEYKKQKQKRLKAAAAAKKKKQKEEKEKQEVAEEKTTKKKEAKEEMKKKEKQEEEEKQKEKEEQKEKENANEKKVSSSSIISPDSTASSSSSFPSSLANTVPPTPNLNPAAPTQHDVFSIEESLDEQHFKQQQQQEQDEQRKELEGKKGNDRLSKYRLGQHPTEEEDDHQEESEAKKQLSSSTKKSSGMMRMKKVTSKESLDSLDELDTESLPDDDHDETPKSSSGSTSGKNKNSNNNNKHKRLPPPSRHERTSSLMSNSSVASNSSSQQNRHHRNTNSTTSSGGGGGGGVSPRASSHASGLTALMLSSRTSTTSPTSTATVGGKSTTSSSQQQNHHHHHHHQHRRNLSRELTSLQTSSSSIGSVRLLATPSVLKSAAHLHQDVPTTSSSLSTTRTNQQHQQEQQNQLQQSNSKGSYESERRAKKRGSHDSNDGTSLPSRAASALVAPSSTPISNKTNNNAKITRLSPRNVSNISPPIASAAAAAAGSAGGSARNTPTAIFSAGVGKTRTTPPLLVERSGFSSLSVSPSPSSAASGSPANALAAATPASQQNTTASSSTGSTTNNNQQSNSSTGNNNNPTDANKRAALSELNRAMNINKPSIYLRLEYVHFQVILRWCLVVIQFFVLGVLRILFNIRLEKYITVDGPLGRLFGVTNEDAQKEQQQQQEKEEKEKESSSSSSSSSGSSEKKEDEGEEEKKDDDNESMVKKKKED